MNVMSWHSQITTFVSIDDEASCLLPLTRPVESLIDPSIESERRRTNLTSQRQVGESIFERFNASKLGVRSNHYITSTFDGVRRQHR